VTGVVVDASALAAVLFEEPDAASVRRALRGHVLHSTSLVDYELANTALKKLRREPSKTEAILAALLTGSQLTLSRTSPDMVQVAILAAARNLTAYDASYLWLARKLGVPLVTLDRELARTAAAL
jgi:predicted nucleic acid-binding protein